jgi:Arc/MetJ-type ribon-helix-helix transcriptional regulator
MKTLRIRLPDVLAHQIEAESRQRKVSKSDVIRERLSLARPRHTRHASLDMIADLIGSVDALPADLSTEKKKYLKTTGYGQKRHR